MTDDTKPPNYRPLKFAEIDTPGMSTPCVVPTSHKAHSSGYVYIVPRDGMGRRGERMHRLAYLEAHGPDAIPPGYHLDHVCNRKNCVNVSHLRPLDPVEHLRVTMRAAKAKRMAAAWPVWEQNGRPGGFALSKILGISDATCYRYIKEWLAEDEAIAAWRAEMETSEAA